MGPNDKLLRVRVKLFPPEPDDFAVVDHIWDSGSLFLLEPSGSPLRISSSVKDANGKRILGSRIPADSMIAKSIARGEIVTNRVNVSGIDAYGQYLPIASPDGNTARAAEGTEAVTTNISGVGEAAEMTGTASSQLMGLSGNLAAQANKLQGEVGAFVQSLRAA